ncbi:hypothetical protein [Sinosporangium siamense]|uniref:Uncharacterized protein n=1 Tax=Sinosporangium siamense TaxID=1367973 RepID=A0A919V5A1_9ACTN|nr:hypothetical protein [Sinosporangium siamense]GII90616.1 hypothetical protein Ssi02_08470 [Sinosporangium siamense]
MDTRTAPQRLADLAARRFPLIARSQVISRPLSTRISQIESRAGQARQNGPDGVLRAAEALNLAALLISDLGIPQLARDLCWRQFDLFRAAGPLPSAVAQLALQPIINIARLRTRAGAGSAAFQLLHDLFAAVTSQTTDELDGRTVDLSGFTLSHDDHHEIRTWLWGVLLVDGMRALARAGDWERALDHAEQLRAVGRNLGDGRQIAVLAHTFAGRYADAHLLLTQSEFADLWEETVANCLLVLRLRMAGENAEGVVRQMVSDFLSLDHELPLVAVTSRLGLTVLDLSNEEGLSLDMQPVLERLSAMATAPGGGYAARDLLKHPSSANLSQVQLLELARAVELGGLGRGELPGDLRARFSVAVETSESRLSELPPPSSR